MAHPDNEPGKSYDIDERRRLAALNACDGLPTEWLERGFIKSLYAFAACVAVADKMADRVDGQVRIPATWWSDHIRAEIDALNNLANPDRLQ